MAAKDPFQAVFERISLEKNLTEVRAGVLRSVFGVTNRKKAAVALNAELHHFEQTFIKTFINTQTSTPTIIDTSPNQGEVSKSTGINWKGLSKEWQKKKRAKKVALPSFFHYGVARNPTSKGKFAKPEMTLKTYLTTHWPSQKVLKTFGYITEKDIIFTNSRGTDVTLKQGKANSELPFLGKLKTARKDITNESERFSIGFRAFPKINFEAFTTNSGKQVELLKHLIPLSDNTAALGYPFAKLTNNHELAGNRALRPTLVPLLNWYYRVKLPYVFKQFYKTKGLTGK